MSRKPIFRRILDSMIESRARQAQRYVDAYRKLHETDMRQG